MNEKKTSYYQYGIPLPSISFEEKDYENNLKFIHNILYILNKTESFKDNERSEYLNIYISEHELLEEINYIFEKLNKEPLNVTGKSTNNINEENVNYTSINTDKIQNDEDTISELLKLVEEGKKKQEEFRLKNQLLQENYNGISLQYNQLIEQNNQIIGQNNNLSKKYKECVDNYNELDNNYSNELNEFKKRIITQRKNLVESNEKSNKQANEIKSLKDDLEKKEDIIDRISYREIGSRIIQFFYLCQPKEKIEYYEKNNISKRNINIIIQYIKTNLSFYYQYMRDLYS